MGRKATMYLELMGVTPGAYKVRDAVGKSHWLPRSITRLGGEIAKGTYPIHEFRRELWMVTRKRIKGIKDKT